jgi:hypothetical protein
MGKPTRTQAGRVAFANPAMVGHDLGACPFCGLHIAAEIDDGAVMHALPTCATFDAMDALTFITEVRKYHERHGAN